MPFVQGVVTSCEPVKNKDNLKVVTVNIGESEEVTIVTNASNIRLDTKTVVATIGTDLEYDGETITIKKTNVGGVQSSGMICDSVMLGWSGGSAGTCVNLQNFPEFKIGDPAPREKPRGIGGGPSESKEPELSAKELKALEKEKRKAELAKKKADRKAKKDAGGESKGNDDDEDEDVQKVSSDLAESGINDK
jgi:tRNA-binding EMAP/Myf-like protein